MIREYYNSKEIDLSNVKILKKSNVCKNARKSFLEKEE
jgi:hypothetical protein